MIKLCPKCEKVMEVCIATIKVTSYICLNCNEEWYKLQGEEELKNVVRDNKISV